MKWILPVYVIIGCLFGFYGIIHADDTDKNDEFKINWGMIIFMIMMALSAVVAKIVGIL